jgi:hypothetical protein
MFQESRGLKAKEDFSLRGKKVSGFLGIWSSKPLWAGPQSRIAWVLAPVTPGGPPGLPEGEQAKGRRQAQGLPTLDMGFP